MEFLVSRHCVLLLPCNLKAASADRLSDVLSKADISFKKHGSKKAQKTAKGMGIEPLVYEDEDDGEDEGSPKAPEGEVAPPNKGILRSVAGWVAGKLW